MRTIRFSTLGPVALALVALAACGRSKSSTPGDLASDLALSSGNGLALANQQDQATYALTETAPKAAPTAGKSIKPAATGNKAVHSAHPTVHAAPEEASAPEQDPTPEVMTTASAPQPAQTTPTADAPAVPRPVPEPVSTGSVPSAGNGQGSGTGSTIGAVLGGIFGAVIRGGGVDGDNCEPAGGRGTARGRMGGGVYGGNPNSGGGVWGSHNGGIGTGRVPINP